MTFQDGDRRLLRRYYEGEQAEHDRLYDFTVAYSAYFERSRVDCVLALVNEVLNDAAGSVLEVGCGSGFFVEKLSAKTDIVCGLELSRTKLGNARDRLTNAVLVQGDAEKLPFADKSFDLILCTEVVEHLVDPLAALREIGRVSNRYAVITTPTNTSLYRLCKARLGLRVKHGGTHIREFTQKELLEACREAGLEVVRITCTPVLEFPGVYWLLRSRMVSAVLYRLNRILQPALSRFGVFSCLLLQKSGG